MVSQLTALTKSGLKDWLVQRISAGYMAFYILFIIGVFCANPHMSFVAWVTLFSHLWMKLLTLGVIVMVLAHAWVGFWTILTDYVKCAVLRGLLQVLMILAIFACLVYGVLVLWGI